MPATLRAVVSRLHHLPWLLAVAVLAFGLFTYSARTPETDLAEKISQTPDPEEPKYYVDEATFRQMVKPGDVFEQPQFEDFGKVAPAGSGQQ